jgi:hypothetical protein
MAMGVAVIEPGTSVVLPSTVSLKTTPVASVPLLLIWTV